MTRAPRWPSIALACALGAGAAGCDGQDGLDGGIEDAGACPDDGGTSDPDCGESACPCALGGACRTPRDCQSGACSAGTCTGRRTLAFAAPVDFVAGMPLSHPGYPSVQSIEAGDLDGDGALDLVVPSTEGVALYVLFGNGKGGFETARIPTKGRPTSVAVASFDGDGYDDIVAGYDGTVLTWVGSRGGRRFDLPVDTEWPAGTYTVTAGDFDGDRKLDVAATSLEGTSVAIGLGDGRGGFSPRMAGMLTGVARFVVPGDLDGDGLSDLAVAEAWQVLDVFLGRPGGLLERTLQYQVDSTTVDCPAFADLDLDGRLDLVATPTSTGVVVLRGNRTGKPAPGPPLPLPGHSDGLRVADLDLDGNPDLVLARDAAATVQVLLGDGQGAFTAAPPLPVLGVAIGLAVGDFDQDGLPDIAVAQDQAGASGPTGGVRLFVNRAH